MPPPVRRDVDAPDPSGVTLKLVLLSSSRFARGKDPIANFRQQMKAVRAPCVVKSARTVEVKGDTYSGFTNGLLTRLPGPGIGNLCAKTLNFEMIPDLRAPKGRPFYSQRTALDS